LPAAAWGEVLPKLPQPKILISATKGLERDTVQTPLAFAKQSLQLADERLCVISGPSFASDLAAARPLSIVAASRSEQTAVLVAEALSGDSLRVYASRDPLGVELGGILKNVIAIACGASDSIGFGPSARAALISRGLAEMSRLAAALGADIQTLTGLSGLGDLVMTATEDQSRNRQVGLRLGRGEKIADIIKALGSTAEGVTTAPLVQTLAATSSVVVPITDMVVELLKGEVPPLELAKRLMTRPIKSEF
jgi:glycerol-3-phosphate dehydrogenase (NAD(P)+)